MWLLWCFQLEEEEEVLVPEEEVEQLAELEEVDQEAEWVEDLQG